MLALRACGGWRLPACPAAGCAGGTPSAGPCSRRTARSYYRNMVMLLLIFEGVVALKIALAGFTPLGVWEKAQEMLIDCVRDPRRTPRPSAHGAPPPARSPH